MQRKTRRDYFQSIWLVKVPNTDILQMDLYLNNFFFSYFWGEWLNTKLNIKIVGNFEHLNTV